MLQLLIIVLRDAELPAEVKYPTAMTNDELLTLVLENPSPIHYALAHLI
jgi:hypothetical protein